MAERPQFVVDASVAAKWYLNDEVNADQALEVLRHFLQGKISLLAPDHIRYEVPSAVRNAVRRERVNPAAAREATSIFLGLGLPTTRSSSLILLGHDQAIRFGCSLYDGLYLALALMSQRPLLHADRKLRHALDGRFHLELWIADYQPHGAF
ncbi:MAG: type II toxin-antitoxin system VapC family toxin [Chloroflexi bacterium]|nr:type II toxin-antitoxin system VapC family toxin [Chloroflexota bacterium]